MPCTTNLYKVRLAANRAYGRSTRTTASFVTGSQIDDINEAIEKVCEDNPIFVMKVVDLPATDTSAAKPEVVAVPSDFWLPQYMNLKWKLGISANPLQGRLQVVNKPRLDNQFPGWEMIPITSWPTSLCIDYPEGSWRWYPIPSDSGMIAQLRYPRKPKLFTGVAGEDAVSSAYYIDIPDIFVRRLLGNKLAAIFASEDNEPQRAAFFEQQYQTERTAVDAVLMPYIEELGPRYMDQWLRRDMTKRL
jgi:hypothetical protein